VAPLYDALEEIALGRKNGLPIARLDTGLEFSLRLG
jgi:hypothetical protein